MTFIDRVCEALEGEKGKINLFDSDFDRAIFIIRRMAGEGPGEEEIEEVAKAIVDANYDTRSEPFSVKQSIPKAKAAFKAMMGGK